MFDWVLSTLSSSAWTYPIVFGVVAVDAFFPVVPGDLATITAAILAAGTDLSIVLVVAAGFLGATAGDNFSYLLGNKLGSRAARRLFRGEKASARLEWARDQLRQRGVTLIVGARFIPGGRTATTFAAGTLEMRWRRFLAADLVGTFSWALFTSMLGYLGGQAFRQSLWKPLLLSLAVSGLVVLGGELWQRRTRRTGAGGSGSDEQQASQAQGVQPVEGIASDEPTPVEQTFARRMGDKPRTGR